MLPQGLPPLSGQGLVLHRTGFCITHQCAGKEEKQVAGEPEEGHAFRTGLELLPLLVMLDI